MDNSYLYLIIDILANAARQVNRLLWSSEVTGQLEAGTFLDGVLFAAGRVAEDYGDHDLAVRVAAGDDADAIGRMDALVWANISEGSEGSA